MPRTYDEMIQIALEAKPDLRSELTDQYSGKPHPGRLVPVLDEHYPIDGGWRTKPLQEGPALLRSIIEEQAKASE